MPQFAAHRTDDHPGPFKSIFHVSVDLPLDDGWAGNVQGRAFITDELEESRIAKELAGRYGATSEGDVIDVLLRQISEDGTKISKFPLPVTVKFAHAKRGSEYLQLGFAEVAEHFEVSRYTSKDETTDPSFLFLQRREDCPRECIEIPIE